MNSNRCKAITKCDKTCNRNKGNNHFDYCWQHNSILVCWSSKLVKSLENIERLETMEDKTKVIIDMLESIKMHWVDICKNHKELKTSISDKLRYIVICGKGGPVFMNKILKYCDFFGVHIIRYNECGICNFDYNKNIKLSCCNNTVCSGCWDRMDKCPYCRFPMLNLKQHLLNLYKN